MTIEQGSYRQMTDIFAKLITLQDILVEKYRIKTLINASPQQLQSQDDLLVCLKTEFVEHNTIYGEIREKISKLRTELAEAQIIHECKEKKMDLISTHREYEVLDKEIKETISCEQEARRRLQEEEKKIIDMSEILKREEQLIQNQKSELDVGKNNLAKDIETYKAQLADLKTREQEIVENMNSGEIISKFERIIINKQNQGIVSVEKNVCNGCYMILPFQFANRVRAGKTVEFCPYCSRILYYKKLDSEKAEYFRAEDINSFMDVSNELGEEVDEHDISQKKIE